VYLIAATTVLKVLFIQLGIFFKLKSSRLSYVQICLKYFLYCSCMARFLPKSCFCQEAERKIILYRLLLNKICMNALFCLPGAVIVRTFIWMKNHQHKLIVSIFRCYFSIFRYRSWSISVLHVPHCTESVCFDKPRTCPWESR